jgi:hypothetical protein
MSMGESTEKISLFAGALCNWRKAEGCQGETVPEIAGLLPWGFGEAAGHRTKRRCREGELFIELK